MTHFIKSLLVCCGALEASCLFGECQSWVIRDNFFQEEEAEKTEAVEHIWLHFPGVFAGLEDFAKETVQDVADQLELFEETASIEPKRERATLEAYFDKNESGRTSAEKQLNDIIRSITLAGYNAYFAPRTGPISDSVTELNENQLGLCFCMGIDTRLLTLVHLITYVLDRYPNRKTELNITELASGTLLGQYMLTTALLNLGYTHLNLRLIDPTYAEKKYVAQIALFKKLIATYLAGKGLPSDSVSIKIFNDFASYLTSKSAKSNVTMMFDISAPRECASKFENQAINEYKFDIPGKRPAFVMVPYQEDAPINFYVPDGQEGAYRHTLELIRSAHDKASLKKLLRTSPHFSGSCNNIFFTFRDIVNMTAAPRSIVYTLYNARHRCQTEADDEGVAKFLGEVLTVCQAPATNLQFVGRILLGIPKPGLYNKLVLA